MSAFVYILEDERGKYYIGSTIDIDRRLRQHREKHTFTTKRMQEPKLVLLQKYDSIEVARKIERKVKALKRKDYIQKIVRDGKIKMS